MINSINEVYKSKEAVEHINTEEIPEPDKNTGIRTPEKIKTDKKEENTYSDTSTKEELPEHSNISSEFEEKKEYQKSTYAFILRMKKLNLFLKKFLKETSTCSLTP